MLGGALAVYALFQLFIKPMVSVVQYLIWADELNNTRSQAMYMSSAIVAMVFVVVCLVPVPTTTRTEGIIDVSAQAQLFASQTGELAEVFVQPGDSVQAGQRILRVDDSELATEESVLKSKLDVLTLQYRAAAVTDPASATSLRQDILDTRKNLDQLTRNLSDLVVRAAVPGIVSLNTELTRIGEFINEGTALGHVVDPHNLKVKAVVKQSDIARVEKGVISVNIRLAERFGNSIAGVLTRLKPLIRFFTLSLIYLKTRQP